MKTPLRSTKRITEINVKVPKGARKPRHTATEIIRPNTVAVRNQRPMQHITQQMYTLSDSRVTRAARVRATEKRNDTTQNTPPVKHDDTAVSQCADTPFQLTTGTGTGKHSQYSNSQNTHS